MNETIKKDFQDLQNKYHNLENEHEKHLSSNEELKTTNDTALIEKQTLIDQLTKQINEMQQTQVELVEKQINQHTEFERRFSQDKKSYEKSLQEKIEEYEIKIQSMKSIRRQIDNKHEILNLCFLGEYLIETENSKIEHEQEKLRLKSQLHQALQGKYLITDFLKYIFLIKVLKIKQVQIPISNNLNMN